MKRVLVFSLVMLGVLFWGGQQTQAALIKIEFTGSNFAPGGGLETELSGTILYNASLSIYQVDSLVAIEGLTIGGHTFDLSDIGFGIKAGTQAIGALIGDGDVFHIGTTYNPDFNLSWLLVDGSFTSFGYSSAVNYYYAGTKSLSFTVVPEPSTMLLLGSGLVGLVGYGRRQMKK